MTLPAMPPLLRRFWLWIAGLTAASVVFTLAMTHVFGMRPYYSIIQLYSPAMFDDFWLFHARFMAFHTYEFWHRVDYPFTYPAILGVVFAALFKVPHPLRFYFAIYTAGLLGWVWWMGRRLATAGVPMRLGVGFAATILLTCWPVFFLLDTANIEGIVVLVVAGGIFAVLRERWWLAAGLFGLAGAMKLYPFVLLGLLLSRRKYREFAFAFLVAIASNFAGLAILGPTMHEAQANIDAGLLYVKQSFMAALVPQGLPFNHSLFNLVKFAAVGLDSQMRPDATVGRAAGVAALVNSTLTTYGIVAAVGGTVLYFAWIRRLPFLNQLLALMICGVLLPPLSADYTLCELLVPFGLLCWYVADVWHKGAPPVPGTRLALASFGLLFPPGTYFTFIYMYECQFRTVGLLVLLFAVLRYRFPDRVMA